IVSTCYEGELNHKFGRIKISHRFNQAGRIDFVELKYLRSLEPMLNGTLRKLVMIKDFQQSRKDWRTAEAFVLQVLPRELVFLFPDIFRCERNELIAWLINIGHRLVQDALNDLSALNGSRWLSPSAESEQLCLTAIRSDEV